MRKKIMRNREKPDHRGATRELAREYQLKMNVVHKIPPVYYNNDGEVKSTGRKIK